LPNPASPADLEALREFLETTTDLDHVSDETREIIETYFPDLAHKLPPQKRLRMAMVDDRSDVPIPNGIVITLPDLHRTAAAKLRQSVDPAMAELAEAHERVAREMQERIDREAPPLALV
jgi:hypothetical protein